MKFHVLILLVLFFISSCCGNYINPNIKYYENIDLTVLDNIEGVWIDYYGSSMNYLSIKKEKDIYKIHLRNNDNPDEQDTITAKYNNGIISLNGTMRVYKNLPFNQIYTAKIDTFETLIPASHLDLEIDCIPVNPDSINNHFIFDNMSFSRIDSSDFKSAIRIIGN